MIEYITTMKTKNDELEVMREQLVLLNKKLEDQTLVNDRLVRDAMKSKMSWIKRYVLGEVVLLPFLICFLFVFPFYSIVSYSPVVFISVMLVVAVVSDFKINMIDDRAFVDGNLAETAQRLTKMRRQRIVYEKFMLPFLAIWLIWFSYDIYNHIPAEGVLRSTLTGGLVGSVIGGVVGTICGLLVLRRMQRTNSEIIQEINELVEN